MKPPSNRPLSPHIQIYKPQITSVLSILHRITGVFLTLGLFSLVWGLYTLKYASLGEADPCCSSAVLKFLGGGIFLAWIFSLFFHLYNGIRHLLWDVGIGLELNQVYRSGYIVIVMTLASTLIVLGGLLWRA